MSGIAFELLPALWVGAAAAGVLVAWSARQQRAHGLAAWRVLALAALRTTALLLLALLLARPTTLTEAASGQRSRVAVLIDRSESMGLAEDGRPRWERALALARTTVLPALKEQGLGAEGILFADEVRNAPESQWATARADGPATDLAAAIAQATAEVPPPVAVIALTDGAANERAQNRAALAGLVDTGAPFVAIGIGSDRGVSTLSLLHVSAPASVAPKQEFQLSVQLQAVTDTEIAPFDLLLTRDGRFAERKRVTPGKGSRFWSESFRLKEDEAGLHELAVSLEAAPQKDVVLPNRTGAARVVVAKEREFRVLFVQGRLTWDFKFIGRALRADPSVRLTGLSRTSEHSIFRQNVEESGELAGGFPASLDQIAPYRVVVLSDMRPADLAPAQQDVLARFVSELGGGVLMLGGPATFDASWQGSRLEQLLPVTFDPAPGVLGLDRPFHLRLTDDARRSPVFAVAAGGATDAWDRLPTFGQYGRVRNAKPGATVWATHGEDKGPDGPRILMASQPYGAGVSAVVCVQNFWRWRLAKEADPQQFDRFWQQFFRWLGQAARQDVTIELPDQELAPRGEVKVVLLRPPQPEGATTPAATTARFKVRVSEPGGARVLDQELELPPGRPVSVAFRAARAGLHTISVVDLHEASLASRAVEIRDARREMERTGRDMESLKQWAELSHGQALREEDGIGPRELGDVLRQSMVRARESQRRQPWGLTATMLAVIAGALSGEWALRRRWDLA